MRWSSALEALKMPLLGLAGIGLVAWQRAPLTRSYEASRAGHDVYLLPAAEQTVVASLGYRSALADLIWAHVRVAQGLHFQDKRLFEFVGQYLETIVTLDPKFRDPYRYADTLLTLQPVEPPQEFYLEARRLMKRGLQELPNDQELWLTTGQFLAYIFPGRVRDPELKETARLEGTRALARACELIGSNENIPFQCITAAALLDERGDREATRQFLEKLLSISDDPDIRRLAAALLERALGAERQAEVVARRQRFQELWKQDLGFVPREQMLALAPRFDVARCAGREAPRDAACATSFRDWAERSAEASNP